MDGLFLLKSSIRLPMLSLQRTFLFWFSQFGSVSLGDRLPYVAAHQGTFSTGVKTENVSINGVTNYRGKDA